MDEERKRFGRRIGVKLGTKLRLKIVMRIWEGWWWVLGRRFPLFPEEILTKQGNVFIGLPLLVSAVSD